MELSISILHSQASEILFDVNKGSVGPDSVIFILFFE